MEQKNLRFTLDEAIWYYIYHHYSNTCPELKLTDVQYYLDPDFRHVLAVVQHEKRESRDT